MAALDHPLYRTIVADPAWPFAWSGGATNRRNGRGELHNNGAASNRALPYRTMTIEAIADLNVSQFAAEQAALFLWIPDRLLLAGVAPAIVAAWGFEAPRLLVWHKTGIGLGTFPRPAHEQVVVARRGAADWRRRDVGSVHRWKVVYEKGRGRAARRQHSAKPDGFFDLVMSCSPGPYLSLFERKQRLGWDTWGDEALEHVTIESAR